MSGEGGATVQRKEHLGPMMVKMRYDKQNELELMGLYFDVGRASDKQENTRRRENCLTRLADTWRYGVVSERACSVVRR